MARKTKWMSMILVLAALLIIAVACNNSSEEPETTPEPTVSETPSSDSTQTPAEQTPGAALPFAATTTFSVFGKGYWNPIDTPIAYQDIKAKLNVNFEWDVYPDGFDEKKDIMLSTKSLKELNQVYIRDGFNYGPKGAFLDLSKYLDKLPNLKQKIEENDDIKYSFMAEDGSFYVAPQFVYNATDRDSGLAVNHDKFAEWGIPTPKTLDDVYQAAVKIKAMDAKYYPIIGWTDPNQLFSVLRSLMNYAGIGDEPDVRFFPGEDVYKYSLLQPEFKESVAWLAKAYAEELIFPEYPTTTSAGTRPFWSEWEVAGDDMYNHFISFIGPFAPYNSDQFQRFHEQTKARGEVHNPQFDHLWLSNSMSFNVKRVEPLNGLAINAEVARDEAKLNDMLTYVNWLYSDEAYYLFNYGREGWHYTMVDGKAKMNGLFVFGQPEYMEALVSDRFKMFNEVGYDASKISLEDQLYSWGFYEAYNFLPMRMIDERDSGQQQFPSLRTHDEIYSTLAAKVETAATTGIKPLPFTAEESNKIANLSQAARDFALTEVDQFILGRRSMDQFDAFIAELKNRGAQELENMYNAKYAYSK